MSAAVVDLLPVFSSDDVSQGQKIVVKDHLGLACRAGREVDDHGIFVMCCFITCGPVENGRSRIDVVGKRTPALGCFADNAADLYCLAVGTCAVDVVDDPLVVCADDHLNVGSIAAVNDIVILELESGGDNDRAELVKTDHGEPYFRTLAEDHEDPVALLDSEALEHVGYAVALFLDVGKGEVLLVAVIVAPDECFTVGLVVSIHVDDVESEVKVLGDLQLEVLLEIFIALEINSFDKSFQ